MVCRTTDEYRTMAQAGCLAVGEPAFWAGYDRSSADGFRDYFVQLTECEPARAAKFGMDHYTWLCINPKEAQDVAFARDVMKLIPEFIDRPNVLGIGEIGLNRNTSHEMTIFEEHLDLAVRLNQLVLIHTPHLEDKLKGTVMILSALKNRPDLDPCRVLVDHCEEHTFPLVKEAGYWAGLTLYPTSKLNPKRAADILELYGMDRVWANSAADWGDSDPLALTALACELRRRGFSRQETERLLLENPETFMGQSPKFRPRRGGGYGPLLPVREKDGEDGAQDDRRVIQKAQPADSVKQEFVGSQDVGAGGGQKAYIPFVEKTRFSFSAFEIPEQAQ